MRDRVLETDIVWVAPEDPADSTGATPHGTVGTTTEVTVEHVAPPSLTPGTERPNAPATDAGQSEGIPESIAEWEAGEEDALFGGFGVGGDRFDDPTAGPEPMGPMEPPHHWSVPWSDLMMVMFVLFAVMATTQLDREEPSPPPPEEPVAQRDRIVRPFGDPIMTINVLERAQRVVKESDAENVDIVLMEDQSVKVSVRGPMLFELGSVELRPEVMSFLDDLAAIIRTTPYRIEVIGHTDDQPVATPLFPSNWELSTARASRVARYLMDSGRMAPTRFTVIGRAEYDPVTSNATEAGRSVNRRVEILITREVLPSSEVAIQ